MATPYSDDLRRKLLEAHQRGEGSLPELARRFSVSAGWASKISSQFFQSGKMERQPGQRRGRASKFNEEIRQKLKSWIGQQPDLTLAELQSRLQRECELKASVGRLWAVLREMGMRLKKSHSTPPNRIRKQVKRGGLPGAKRASGLNPQA